MKFSLTILWIALVAVAEAAPKFAVVRVRDIYLGLPSTKALQDEILSQREAILTNKRAEQLRVILGELQVLDAKLQAEKDKLDSEANRKLALDNEIKRQEAETLRKEFEEFRASENRRINGELVLKMRGSLDRITGAVQQIAKERNLDGVFDTSGNSNTGLPFVLYAANAVDISEDVITLLAEKPLDDSENAPDGAGEGEKPAEAGDKPE